MAFYVAHLVLGDCGLRKKCLDREKKKKMLICLLWLNTLKETWFLVVN